MLQGFYNIIYLCILVTCCYGLTRHSEVSEKKSLENINESVKSELIKRKAIIHHHYTHNLPDDEFYYRPRRRRRCHTRRHRRPPHRYYSSYKRNDPYVNYHDNPVTINNDEYKHSFKLNEDGNRVFNSRQNNNIGQSIRHSFYDRPKLNNNNNNKRFFYSSLNKYVDVSINNGKKNITNNNNTNENFVRLLMEYNRNYKSPHAGHTGTFIPSLPNHYTNLRRVENVFSSNLRPDSKINHTRQENVNNCRLVKTLPYFEQDPLDTLPSTFRSQIKPILPNYNYDYHMSEPTPGQIIYPPSVPHFKSIPKLFHGLKNNNNNNNTANRYDNAYKQKSLAILPLTKTATNSSKIIYHRFYEYEAITPRTINVNEHSMINPMNNATISSIKRIKIKENNLNNIKRNPLALNNGLTEKINIKTPYNASIKYITPIGYVFNSNSIKKTLSPVNYKFKEDNNKPVYVYDNKSEGFVAPPIVSRLNEGSSIVYTTIQPQKNQLGPTTVPSIFLPTRPMTFTHKRIEENFKNYHPDNRYVILRTEPIQIDRNNKNINNASKRLENIKKINNYSDVRAVKHTNITSLVALGLNTQPVYYVTPSSIDSTKQMRTNLTSKRSGYKFIAPPKHMTSNNLIKNSTIYTLSNLLADVELETINKNINRIKQNSDNNLINHRKRVLNHVNYNRISLMQPPLTTINKTKKLQESPEHKSVNIKPNMMWIILPKISKTLNNTKYQNTREV